MDDHSRLRLYAIIVITLSAILFFTRLGARALWESEFRWGEISREMLLNHNFFWPTINGHAYFDKPLGSYWLIVASTWLTGGMNETAARLPCAIAGLLALTLLIAMARRLYGLRTGIAAAIILATSFSFVFFSRTASADVETIAGELAALCLFLRYEDRPGRWVIPFWLIMAITSLMKGLLGFVLPILIVGVYSTMADGLAEFRQRILRGSLAARISWLTERNRWFFNWYTLAGITIAVAIYYVPFAISHAETGSSKGLYMVYRENVERYFEPFDHRGPIYLYFYVVFALMAPWSAFLPAALVHAHQRRRETNDHARADRFTLTFFWATFVFFTLSGSRRSYYILPILPAAAILVARLLEAPRETLSGWSKRLLNVGFVAVAAAVALLALALMPPRSILPPPYSLLPVPPHRIILAVGWIGCVGALVYAFRSLDSRRILVSTAVVAYLFMFYFFVFAMPAADQWRGERAFALQVKSVIGSHPEKLVFFRNVGPVYYLNLDRPVPEYQRAPTLAGAIAKGQFRWVVARRRDMNFLKIPAKVAASEAVFPWDSADHRLNAMVLLEVQPPGPFG